MGEEAAGDKIFCSRTSDPDPAYNEGIPATWHTSEVLTKGLQSHWTWSRGKEEYELKTIIIKQPLVTAMSESMVM